MNNIDRKYLIATQFMLKIQDFNANISCSSVVLFNFDFKKTFYININ